MHRLCLSVLFGLLAFEALAKPIESPLVLHQDSTAGEQEPISALPLFGPPDGLSEEAFAELSREAPRLRPATRRRLVELGRRGVPVLINVMLGLDLSQKKGARSARTCHELLSEITGQERLPWSSGIEPEDVRANMQTVRYWHQVWARCEEDPDAWWRLLGFRPGSILSVITSLGFPEAVALEALRFQARIDEDLDAYGAELGDLRTRLDESRAELEAAARAELVDALPVAWSDEELAGHKGVIEAAVVALEINQGVELPWPLGLRHALVDTLRKSRRDAWVNQRKIDVPGLPEALEVSVVTHGDSQYGIVPISVPWATARSICEANGGYLACIETPEELAGIQELFLAGEYRTQRVLGLSEWDMLFWIGASDAAAEGSWTWIDGRKVDPALWLQPVAAAGGGFQRLDHPQPSDVEGSQHCAGLACYTGDPKLDPRLDPRWGMLSWYEGFPARFICEWGYEEQRGPWGRSTMAVLEPYLHTYFRQLLDVEEELRSLELKLDKQLAASRRQLLKRQAATRKDAVKELGELLRAGAATWSTREALLTQQLLWIIEDDRSFPAPPSLGSLPPGPDAVRLMGRRYQLITRPETWDRARRRCEELGGSLASAGRYGSDLGTAGRGAEWLRAWLEADLEGALHRELLAAHDEPRSWLGYRFHGTWAWADRPLAGEWVGFPGPAPLDPGLLIEELARTPHTLGSSWGRGHAAAAVFEALDCRACFTAVQPDAGQTDFPQVFGSVPQPPAHTVKVRVDGSPASTFIFHAADNRLEWTGEALRGDETMLIYASTLASASVDRRLPYICAWDG